MGTPNAHGFCERKLREDLIVAPIPLFGAEKRGAGFLYRFYWRKRIKSKMSETDWRSFEEYDKKHPKYNIFAELAFFWRVRNVFFGSIGFPAEGPSKDEIRNMAAPTMVKYMIPWSGNYMMQKYRDALKEQEV